MQFFVINTVYKKSWESNRFPNYSVPAPGHSTWGGLYDSRGGGGLLYKTSRQILIEWIIIVAFPTHHI